MNNSNDRRWHRAQRYLAEGQVVPAKAALESLLQREPQHLHATLALSKVEYAVGRIRSAVEHALAVAGNPLVDGDLAIDAAEVLRQLGETTAARQCLDHPELIKSTDGDVLFRMAVLRKLLGEHSEALSLFNKAAAVGMSTSAFRFERAQELMSNGHLDEAESELRTCLHLAPGHGQAALMLSRARRQTSQSNHLDDLRSRLREVAKGSEDHAALEFALYKELEDLGCYDEAWDALAKANAIMYARQQHDPMYAWHLFNSLIDSCTQQFLQARGINHAGPQPIFIVGMPRSGTTLLERILSNHSQVTSAGELSEFGLQLRWEADHRTTLDEYILRYLPGLDYARIGRRYLERTQWRANGAGFFIDKLPRNWMLVGLIHRALPQARILNLVRDPMDVCFSNFRTQVMGDLLPWGYDLHALAQHYLQYCRVMEHWHNAMPGGVLDVSYEMLTKAPEHTARMVLGYCGLEWEDGCTDITRNKAAVATLSQLQVREPIHSRAFEEWRHYERQLQPLRKMLAI